MTIGVGFRDILTVCKARNLPYHNEFDLLAPKALNNVAEILHDLGIDLTKNYEIRACKYRDLNDEVGIGYRIDGFMRLDREWVNSPLCDVMLRIAATSHYDTSLTRQLCELIGKATDFMQDQEEPYKSATEDGFPNELLSDTYEEDTKFINFLNEIYKQNKGSQ